MGGWAPRSRYPNFDFLRQPVVRAVWQPEGGVSGAIITHKHLTSDAAFGDANAQSLAGAPTGRSLDDSRIFGGSGAPRRAPVFGGRGIAGFGSLGIHVLLFPLIGRRRSHRALPAALGRVRGAGDDSRVASQLPSGI